MKRILIAGVGNILLGDDGIGPYVVRKLAANYVFEEGVELEDLGTPALDFIDHIAGLDALIVVDAVKNGEAPGTIVLYGKAELLRHSPTLRMDPHSPALIESLMAADLFGQSPENVILVGIAGESYSPTCAISPAVAAAVDAAIRRILQLLDSLDVGFFRRFEEADPSIWWAEVGAADLA